MSRANTRKRLEWIKAKHGDVVADAIFYFVMRGRRTFPESTRYDRYLPWLARELSRRHALHGFDEIVDWALVERPDLGLLTFPVALRKARAWHRRRARAAGGTVAVGKVVKTWPDGFTLQELPVSVLDAEGKAMGNCISSKNYGKEVEKGEAAIFSLRDAKGHPHVDIEAGIFREIDTDDAAFHGTISHVGQVRGKGNAFPADRYGRYVVEWLDEILPREGPIPGPGVNEVVADDLSSWGEGICCLPPESFTAVAFQRFGEVLEAAWDARKSKGNTNVKLVLPFAKATRWRAGNRTDVYVDVERDGMRLTAAVESTLWWENLAKRIRPLLKANDCDVAARLEGGQWTLFPEKVLAQHLVRPPRVQEVVPVRGVAIWRDLLVARKRILLAANRSFAKRRALVKGTISDRGLRRVLDRLAGSSGRKA